MRGALLLLLVFLLLALGCGQPAPFQDGGAPDDGGLAATDAGSDAGGVVPLDGGLRDAGVEPFEAARWCELYGIARCAREVRCRQRGEGDVEVCLARARARCDQEAYDAAVAGGRMAFDGAAAARCVNEYASFRCAGEPDACATLFTGLSAPDAGCLVTEECRSGAFCDHSARTCPSHCRAFSAAGESCGGSGERCGADTGGCRYLDGGFHCAPLRALGEACKSWSDCGAPGACLDGTCVARDAELGEPCATTQGYPTCAADQFCRRELDPATSQLGPGTCQLRAALGGVCTGYGTCLPGLRCSTLYATGTCVPESAEGEPCATHTDCQAELFCQLATSRCVRLPSDGGDCGWQASFYECAFGQHCDYQTDTCRPKGSVGETCVYDGMCLSGDCDDGVFPDGGPGRVCVERCAVRLDGGF